MDEGHLSTHDYITVDWEKEGATQGTAVLVSRLRAAGAHVIDGGQGAALALDTGEPLYKVLNQNISIGTGPYNTSAGGDDFVRNAAFEYMHDVYRVPATKQSAFLNQALGRANVELMMRESAHDKIANIMDGTLAPGKLYTMMSREHWANLSASANNNNLQLHTFDNRNPNIDEAVITSLKSVDKRYLSALLLNYPKNPTAQEASPTQIKNIINYVQDANQQEGVDIHMIFDVPYAFAAEAGRDEKGPYLKSGLQHVLDDVQGLNWSVVVSFSKLFALAKSGATILTVNEERAKDIGTKLCQNGMGLSQLSSFTHNVAGIIGRGNRTMLWDRKGELREQFIANRAALEAAFPNNIVPGSANMLSLLEFDMKEIFGRVVQCHDNQERVLKDGFDVVTYLANEFGAAAVNAGVEGDKFKLRIAGREKAENFSHLVYNLKEGMQAIKQSPLESHLVHH